MIGIDLGITTLHLHSTMLLLYPWGDRVVFFELRIYIPLCFYFINLGRDYINVVNKFTFHYASTLSLPYAFLILKHRNLHSTMLLLYRIDSHRLGDQFRNLHSTMLLLYRHHLIYTVIIHSFTFHYASTLSGDDIMAKAKYTRFTFHYASTLSKARWHTSLWMRFIYIPLCFYFISQIMETVHLQ